MKEWYRLVRFDCPRCGQRLAVERGQILRCERVVCNACNTDLVLAPKGGAANLPPVNRNTGERATLVELPA